MGTVKRVTVESATLGRDNEGNPRWEVRAFIEGVTNKYSTPLHFPGSWAYQILKGDVVYAEVEQGRLKDGKAGMYKTDYWWNCVAWDVQLGVESVPRTPQTAAPASQPVAGDYDRAKALEMWQSRFSYQGYQQIGAYHGMIFKEACAFARQHQTIDNPPTTIPWVLDYYKELLLQDREAWHILGDFLKDTDSKSPERPTEQRNEDSEVQALEDEMNAPVPENRTFQNRGALLMAAHTELGLNREQVQQILEAKVLNEIQPDYDADGNPDGFAQAWKRLLNAERGE